MLPAGATQPCGGISRPAGQSQSRTEQPDIGTGGGVMHARIQRAESGTLLALLPQQPAERQQQEGLLPSLLGNGEERARHRTCRG